MPISPHRGPGASRARSRVIPTSLLTPLPFNFQLVALNGTLAAGNTSNPAIFTIQ